MTVDADPLMSEQWQRALRWWGVDQAPRPRPGGVVLAASAQAAVATGADSVLLAGRDRAGVLAAAGYRTRTWQARPAGGGAASLVTDGGLRPVPVRRSTVRGAARAGAVSAVRRLSGVPCVTVGSRTAGPPALAAEVGADRAYVLAGGGGPRRRPVLLTARPSDRVAAEALKVSPARDAVRGGREQQVLRSLHDRGMDAHLPRPLGEGRLGPFTWSRETASSGRPLADVLGERSAATRTRTLLGQVADWLGELGARTRGPHADLAGLPLADEHRRRASLLEGRDVPGVLVHGDLAAGFNLLVDGGSWVVIDWETAREAGPPLLDLLPLMTGALAALHAPAGAEQQAAYVLRLCAGLEADSRFLLGTVAAYLRTVGVPVELAGPLADLAFGYQASMRLVHEDLVRAAGEEPPSWTSAFDHVARQWSSWPGLGPGWGTLRGALRG